MLKKKLSVKRADLPPPPRKRIRKETIYPLLIDKMQIRTIERLELLPTADMHVHLRQGELMELAVPAIGKSGVDTVFVYGSIPSKILKGMKELTKDHRMPNLVRGIFSLVFDYFSRSSKTEPPSYSIRLLMLMYSSIGTPPYDC
jgi:hypothetical protein